MLPHLESGGMSGMCGKGQTQTTSQSGGLQNPFGQGNGMMMPMQNPLLQRGMNPQGGGLQMPGQQLPMQNAMLQRGMMLPAISVTPSSSSV